MEYSDLGDTDLAIAWKRGDPRAFDELVRRFQGRVYAVAFRVTGNREDALDVAQEALIKAYQRINTWQPTGGFLPWLLRLTTNQAIDHLRRRKRQPQERLDETFVPESEGASVEPAVESAGQTVRAHEIDERVRGALHTLSPAQRTVFMLRHYEGQSLAEIAAQMGCTVGSVKVHLFRSLQKLRKELGGLDL
jgi:RNA polymerase sigma-70 factor (ECF subfamily)